MKSHVHEREPELCEARVKSEHQKKSARPENRSKTEQFHVHAHLVFIIMLLFYNRKYHDARAMYASKSAIDNNKNHIFSIW